MLDHEVLEALKQIAHGVATQFGSNCEVVIHEISEKSAYSSIVAIENGHVSGRKVGDGPSHVVLEQIGQSSSVYIRDAAGKIAAIFCINFDVSALQMFEATLHDLITPDLKERKEPERITLNVSDLLDDLIRQADELVGKPVALMNKDDKVKAIRYLNKSGAMMITKSGDKIAKHFGISKYTLYSYLDNGKTGGE